MSSPIDDETKILNPNTGRYVLKNGKIGSKLMSSITPVEPIGTPTKFMRIAEDCLLEGTYDKQERIGFGEAGTVHKVCKLGKCDYVLKEQNADQQFKNEVEALYDLQGWKHTPKVYAAWTCHGKGYIVQELLYKCNLSARDIYTQLKNKVLPELWDRSWVFIDIHDGNIMCRKDGTIVLLDYGWACKFINDASLIPSYHELNSRLRRDVDIATAKKIELINLESNYGDEELAKEMDKELNKDLRIKKSSSSSNSNSSSNSSNSGLKTNLFGSASKKLAF
jgi:serine/threonine protein kinase